MVREDSRKVEDVSLYKWTREKGHPIQRAQRQESTGHALALRIPAERARKIGSERGREGETEKMCGLYTEEAGNKVETSCDRHVEKGIFMT